MLQIKQVNFFPLRFYSNQILSSPSIGVSYSHMKAKSMNGMDKRYDGHV
jgi:hypothetical protein